MASAPVPCLMNNPCSGRDDDGGKTIHQRWRRGQRKKCKPWRGDTPGGFSLKSRRGIKPLQFEELSPIISLKAFRALRVLIEVGSGMGDWQKTLPASPAFSCLKYLMLRGLQDVRTCQQVPPTPIGQPRSGWRPGVPASPVLAYWGDGVCFLNAYWRAPNSRSCAGADCGCGPGRRDAKKRPLAGLPSRMRAVLHGAFPHQSTRCSAAAKRAA